MITFNSRMANKKDVSQLSVLFKQVYIDTYGTEGISMEFTNFINHQFSVEKLEAIIESLESNLWLATYKENPVGALIIDYNKQCPIGNKTYAEINKLYILKRFFGKGIGRKLMQTAEEKLKIEGEKDIWLWVLESNTRAINFYNKQGFNSIGTAYFQMETNRYKNVVMSKTL